jgi:16S rRNA (cytidine1402-2'-O)-methyltransferase
MGTLYVVATPIGNLSDITLRALEVLKAVNRVYCEDTRHTRKLLTHFGISKPLASYFAGNEGGRTGEVLSRLKGGESVALVSDAGTPCVSDPGYLLVRACREEGIPVVPVPGPSALTAALSAGGVPTDRVLFLGFAPRRKGERERLLRSLESDPSTLVFYEAPHRVRAFLGEAASLLPGRECVVARELTKRFETILSPAAREEVPEKGEFAILFGPPAAPRAVEADERSLEEEVGALVAAGIREKEAIRTAARRRGMSRREVYSLLKVRPREDT